jgi:hypothetical protein
LSASVMFGTEYRLRSPNFTLFSALSLLLPFL